MKEAYAIEYKNNAGVIVAFDVVTEDILNTLSLIKMDPLFNEFTSVVKIC
jgi:hypothetical protein